MAVDTDGLFDLLFDHGLEPEFMEDETEVVICCPLCGDDRTRFYISIDTGQWICFKCDERGHLMELFTRCLEMTPDEAYEVRAKLFSDDRPGTKLSPDKRETEDDVEVAKGLSVELPPEYRAINAQSPKPFLDYLAGRHVHLALAIRCSIGYALRGKYAGRVILPVLTGGVLYSFIARTILKRCPNCTVPIDDCLCQHPYRKVLNSEASQPSLTLYNYDFVRQSPASRVILVEGPFDALRRPGEAVALMRSAISPAQIRLLSALHQRGKQVILCLDGDDAGRQGAKKIAEALVSCMIPVRVAELPDGEDPGSCLEDVLINRLETAKEFSW